MLKILGVMLIMTGSAGLGVFYKMQYAFGTEVLYDLKRILELFCSEIGYGNATFHDCVKSVSENAASPYAQVLQDIYARLCGDGDEAFYTIWEEEMGKFLESVPLQSEETKPFITFAKQEGITDTAMQLRAIGQSLDMLSTAIKKREENREKQGKLSLCLGCMGGLFIAILLL